MYTLDLFKRITQIPRPSGKEEKIRDFLIKKAVAQNYSYRIDEAGNVVIFVEGSGKSSNSPTVVLQCHMDMVYEKTPSTQIDFLKDPLNVYEKDGYLRADGTTLGADNGVGIALAFFCATLADHPPLEIVLTVDEEVGMTGAHKMQRGFFTGNRLINLDSGTMGVITIGSAGGNDSITTLLLERDTHYEATAKLEVELQGLRGGHSGGNIGLGRLSATKVLSDLLQQYLRENFDFRIDYIDAGVANNAIARNGKMVLFFRNDQQAHQAMTISSSLKSADGEDLEVIYNYSDVDNCVQPLTKKVQDDLLYLLEELPHGVMDWQDEKAGLPKTSSNLASIKWLEEKICIVVSYRSFDNDMLLSVEKKICSIVDKTSGLVALGDSYPAWPPKSGGSLVHKYVEVYENLFGKSPQIVARHVGLECGYWERLSPGVEVISIGPNLFDLHSPTERVEVASIHQMEQLLTAMMKEL